MEKNEYSNPNILSKISYLITQVDRVNAPKATNTLYLIFEN